jgi:hypothetical protein
MDVRTVSTLHTKPDRAEGETERRLYAVRVREETAFFTESERVALAWTEAVTLVGQGHVPDDIYQQARGSFSENELVNLTLAIIVINGWNRLRSVFAPYLGPTNASGRTSEDLRPWLSSSRRRREVRSRNLRAQATCQGELVLRTNGSVPKRNLLPASLLIVSV